eukprot:m.26247 g.26247  ORF g.26247 m.26247 type:complete len:92 (+) comp10005_c0_seq1:300-575(+)
MCCLVLVCSLRLVFSVSRWLVIIMHIRASISEFALGPGAVLARQLGRVVVATSDFLTTDAKTTWFIYLIWMCVPTRLVFAFRGKLARYCHG